MLRTASNISALGSGAKPRYRHMTNVVAPGDLRQGLVRFAAGQSFTTLMSRKARLPAKLHAPGLGALAPLIGPRQDEVPLEFREAAEHRQHQSAVGRRGVRPGVAERPESRPALADSRQGVEEVTS